MRTNQKKEEELPAAELEASTTVKDAYMLYVVDIYICGFYNRSRKGEAKEGMKACAILGSVVCAIAGDGTRPAHFSELSLCDA